MPLPAPGRSADPAVTPEAVVLDLDHATVGSRGIAYLLDLCIVGTLYLVLGLAEAAFGVSGFVPGWLGLAILLLLVFLLQFGYPILFETLWRGRTPGKAALGLRVVTVEGAPVGVRHAAIRAVIGLFELLATVGSVAVLTSLLNRRGQRLGDLAAGTTVLRARRGGRTGAPIVFAPPPGLESYTARLDTSALGPADYAMVRDTLLRLGNFRADARREVAEAVAAPLISRVAPPPPAGCPAEQWLQCIAAAVQARRPARRTRVAEPGPIATRPTDVPLPPSVSPSSAPATRPPGTGEGAPPVTNEGGFAPPA